MNLGASLTVALKIFTIYVSIYDGEFSELMHSSIYIFKVFFFYCETLKKIYICVCVCVQLMHQNIGDVNLECTKISGETEEEWATKSQ